MPIRTFLLISLVLAGCGKQIYHSLDGASNEQFQRDSASCRANSTMIANNDGLIGVAITQQYIDNCLRAKGWVRVQ